MHAYCNDLFTHYRYIHGSLGRVGHWLQQTNCFLLPSIGPLRVPFLDQPVITYEIPRNWPVAKYIVLNPASNDKSWKSPYNIVYCTYLNYCWRFSPPHFNNNTYTTMARVRHTHTDTRKNIIIGTTYRFQRSMDVATGKCLFLHFYYILFFCILGSGGISISIDIRIFILI